jgi:acetyl esterase
MKLDPQARTLLERVGQASYPPIRTVAPVEGRRIYRAICRALQPPAPDVGAVSDLSFPGPGGPVALRLYRPRLQTAEAAATAAAAAMEPEAAAGAAGGAPDAPLPAVVFFHGGGFTIWDLETHDVPCRRLAHLARCAVLAVDYRLAPEHRFPAAFDDGVAAVRWIAAHAAELGLDPERIAVAGDSAGGNLAAGAALALRGEHPRIVLQVLIYPCLDMRGALPSHQEFARGYLLEREDTLWFAGNYLRDNSDALDWRASPLLAEDHGGLPPAYIFTAGFDPLRDEGAAYAERLGAAGVRVTYECFEGMIHGFITMGAALAAADHALYRMAQGLRLAFSPDARRS